MASIAAVVALSLGLGGCGGAGSVPGVTGDAGGAGRDADTQGPVTGNASGAVRDMATQGPVQGATVTIGAQSDVTGADGRYYITGITPVGVYSVTCTAPGWTVPGSLRAVEINEGENAIDDIYMAADGNLPPAPPF
ncbi:MAG: carboxypeptidase-like regulatory domain-containing protein [Armatimonadota bacterium]